MKYNLSFPKIFHRIYAPYQNKFPLQDAHWDWLEAIEDYFQYQKADHFMSLIDLSFEGSDETESREYDYMDKSYPKNPATIINLGHFEALNGEGPEGDCVYLYLLYLSNHYNDFVLVDLLKKHLGIHLGGTTSSSYLKSIPFSELYQRFFPSPQDISSLCSSGFFNLHKNDILSPLFFLLNQSAEDAKNIIESKNQIDDWVRFIQQLTLNPYLYEKYYQIFHKETKTPSISDDVDPKWRQLEDAGLKHLLSIINQICRHEGTIEELKNPSQYEKLQYALDQLFRVLLSSLHSKAELSVEHRTGTSLQHSSPEPLEALIFREVIECLRERVYPELEFNSLTYSFSFYKHFTQQLQKIYPHTWEDFSAHLYQKEKKHWFLSYISHPNSIQNPLSMISNLILNGEIYKEHGRDVYMPCLFHFMKEQAPNTYENIKHLEGYFTGRRALNHLKSSQNELNTATEELRLHISIMDETEKKTKTQHKRKI